jgi:hypothetical protein
MKYGNLVHADCTFVATMITRPGAHAPGTLGVAW